MKRWLLPALCGVGLLLPPALAPAQPNPKAESFFETKIRPVLVANCFNCHGEKKQSGGLRLDSRAALLEGGDTGPAIVPGEPAKSLLVKAIGHGDEHLKMPPKKKLAKQQIDDLGLWVRIGAPWPGANAAVAPPRKGPEITAADREHWAFKPVRRPPLPPGTARNPVDRFVFAKLREKGLSPSPAAERRELIRRVSFGLTGLPPTPEEVDAFLRDKSPDAYEKLIGRLLASPRYGEAQARHWLDLVRFAQTNGYERDDEKPNAWRYRDYVIQSFNDDKPYDRFVKEQIAGDELDAVTDESLIATGFFRLGVWDDEPDDAKQAEFDDLDDLLATTGEAFLGLTLGCARCHDHKFDPIPAEDYYGMLAFLRNVRPFKMKGQDQTVFVNLKAGGQALVVTEDPKAKPTHVLVRGNAATPGKEVAPHFPRVLCPTDAAATPKLPAASPSGKSTGRRRVLAEWVASRDNSLTARVIVNRVWQYHFGRGIVATPNDFGRNGAKPSHPELLDYLAAELMENGWRLKHIHRLILTSETYRQSSRARSAERGARSEDAALAGASGSLVFSFIPHSALRTPQSADPDNRLLWRQNMRRLEAEAIRDSVLAVSGRLNLTMGGRGIFPDLPKEVLSTQSRPGYGWSKTPPEEQGRRSVYVYVKRTLGVPLLDAFDFPSPDKPAAARVTTTIAPQALTLLNSGFMEESAAAFADRLLREGGPDPERNIDRAFRLALGRRPSEPERRIAQDYLERGLTAARADKMDGSEYRRALAGLCKLVLNLNEFLYVD